MIDAARARQIAEERVAALHRESAEEDAWVIIKTVERLWGWGFAYQTERFASTGNSLHGLVGGMPFAVLANDGSVHDLPGHPPMVWRGSLEERMGLFEEARRDLFERPRSRG